MPVTECVCDDEPVSKPLKINLLSPVRVKAPGPAGAIQVAGVTIPLVVDETLPPGTIEMRSPGHAPVRVVNIAPDDSTAG
jgi:hypothetical protein